FAIDENGLAEHKGRFGPLALGNNEPGEIRDAAVQKLLELSLHRWRGLASRDVNRAAGPVGTGADDVHSERVSEATGVQPMELRRHLMGESLHFGLHEKARGDVDDPMTGARRITPARACQVGA